jgi:hypothetical protein
MNVPPGFANTYNVQLLLDRPHSLNRDALLQRLEMRCGPSKPVSSDKQDFLVFFHEKYPVKYKEGEVPAQSMITLHDKPLEGQALTPALQQTWDWEGAKAAAAKHRASIMVADLMGSGLPYKDRLRLFHNVVLSVLELTPCMAILWTASDKLIDPSEYLDSKKPERYDPIYPAVNVRLFRIENRLPGEMVMDTLGLAALGLPDLQCHFTGLEPNEMARVLYNSAYYLFEQGDVIHDGETIQGIHKTDRWRCQHEMALVNPEREVLDLNPGKPYVAGERE